VKERSKGFTPEKKVYSIRETNQSCCGLKGNAVVALEQTQKERKGGWKESSVCLEEKLQPFGLDSAKREAYGGNGGKRRIQWRSSDSPG